jgi:hypothetical protein
MNVARRIRRSAASFKTSREINEGIIDILDLNDAGADAVVHSIDLSRKANMLRTVAVKTAPPEKRDGIGKLFADIFKQNDYQIVMAHSPFERVQDEAVRTVARDGKVQVQDPMWISRSSSRS